LLRCAWRSFCLVVGVAALAHTLAHFVINDVENRQHSFEWAGFQRIAGPQLPALMYF